MAITVPTDRPVTPDDFPEEVDRALLEGSSQEEMRRYLSRLARAEEDLEAAKEGEPELDDWQLDLYSTPRRRRTAR